MSAGAGHDEVPLAERPAQNTPGHWLLARLGKRVLRPGGLKLTMSMLQRVGIQGSDVVEFAPGLGRTAREIVAMQPASYVGVEQDQTATQAVTRVVGSSGRVVNANAAKSGLPDECADVVIGEAMLTMQTEVGKQRIVGEAVRLLKPGGCYAIHELGLYPDSLADEQKESLRKDLAKVIKVNARPLTVAEWSSLLEGAGLKVIWTGMAPMALLKMRRNIADEGLRGTLRIIRNVLRDGEARKRVLTMRALFAKHSDTLRGVSLIARKPE